MKKVMTKIIDYLILLASSFISVLLFTILFIVVFGDRGTGLAWGISLGLIINHFLLSFFFIKQGIWESVVKTVIYSGFLFALFYIIANYLDFSFNKILYVISLIIASEISSICTNFLYRYRTIVSCGNVSNERRKR